jgi:hypothetical protein
MWGEAVGGRDASSGRVRGDRASTGSQLERPHERDRFDPVVEAARYGLSRELSLAIWERVCADATDSTGRRDEEQARQRFEGSYARRHF